MPDPKQTPAMKQYYEMKAQYQDAVLFFRMGDFYEMFEDDAVLVSKELGLTLTTRNKNSSNPVPLAGLPYHARERYIAELTRKGYKVAICEQTSDPKLPGLVQREVVQIVTPGTTYQEEVVEKKSNNYLSCITEMDGVFALASVDVQTGEMCVTEVRSMEELRSEVFRMMPRESIVSKDLFFGTDIGDILRRQFGIHVYQYESFRDAVTVIKEFFAVDTLYAFQLEGKPAATKACGTLLQYLRDTQKQFVTKIPHITWYTLTDYIELDEATIRNLELFYTSYDGQKEGSLAEHLDETVTNAGGRLLRSWLMRPLRKKDLINARLDAVASFNTAGTHRDMCRTSLKSLPDIARLLARLSGPRRQVADLFALRDTIPLVTDITEHIPEASSMLQAIRNGLQEEGSKLAGLKSWLDQAFIPTGSYEIGANQGYVSNGYSPEIDSLRELSHNAKGILDQMQQDEIAASGIATLRIKFTEAFGYFIEVSKNQSSRVPERYTRKQTLVNAERYITPELTELGEKIMNSEGQLISLEQAVFEEAVQKIMLHAKHLLTISTLLAQLDVILAFSYISMRYKYTRPELSDSYGISIVKGRHPVLEKYVDFIPNSLSLAREDQEIMILTGPNMAGKSTYLRQNAIIVLMAHIGCFVPAEGARLHICDRIFTRLGAHDALMRGESTFMVEMKEMAYILRQATERSFIILDEVGRGTSTYDGMSLAWSIVTYLHEKIRAVTLFATHYHELIDDTKHLERVVHYSTAVAESSKGLVFLRTIIPGGVSKSYGIEVAKKAGIPQEVTDMAYKKLHLMETYSQERGREQGGVAQVNLFEAIPAQPSESQVEKTLKNLNVEEMRPLDALMLLNELKEKL